MASMVTKPCIQENVRRNKRKFSDDPSLIEVDEVISVHDECTSNQFSGENFEIVQSQLFNACDMCRMKQEASDVVKLQLGLPCPVGPHEATEVFNDPDWNDLIESELEELVLSTFDTVVKSAIKKVVDCGYSEEVVTKAILRSGICYGCKDTLSNMVDNTLAFLKSGQEIDGFSEPYFEDLQQMEKYTLAELVCVLKEAKPFFSTGDAMWYLLLCDMNVLQTCTMETEHVSSVCGDRAPNQTSSPLKAILSETSTEPDLARGPCSRRVATTSNTISDIPVENTFSLSGTSHLPVYEEKFISSKKLSGITKRENILRHKYRSHGSKGNSRRGKLSSLGGLGFDKKPNPIADSSVKVPQPDTNHNILTNNLESDGCNSTSSPKSNNKSWMVTADTELSLSSPAKSCCDLLLHSCNSEAHAFSYNVKPTHKSALHHCVSDDKKDEMIAKLVPRVQELQNQLQKWTEWANKKVMQVACRLGEDKAELKALKKEKDDFDCFKKKKQMLEENTLKRLSEIDNGLLRAACQVEYAKGTVCKLGAVNDILRREMEAAKSYAAESATRFQEVSRREKSSLLNSQLCEKQKSVYHEELVMDKRRFEELQRKLEQEEAFRDQLEGRWKRENQAKEEILSQCISLKEEKEKIEASTKSKEGAMKSVAEKKLQKRKDEIQKLEKEISQLRLKTDSSKIADLRRNIDGSYLSKQTNNAKVFSASTECLQFISKIVTDTGHGCVKRERECVMCLSEEMSVVFLPCAHQVLCTACNELHEKQGMENCPSCRSLIQQRIRLVRQRNFTRVLS